MKDRKNISQKLLLIAFLKKWPLHLFLLPVFFIFHLYVQYSGLLDHKEVAFSFLKVAAGLMLFFLLMKLILKTTVKAAVITTLFSGLFLFFGDLKQAFSLIPILNHLAHYKILIPLLLILMIVAFYIIRRSKSLTRSTLFLNILLLIYLVIDTVKSASLFQNKMELNNTDLLLKSTDTSPTKDVRLPNIYYIVLDGYPSTPYQQEELGVKKNYLDSSLSAKGFYVLKNPRSNYNKTAFSMAGTLSMNYFSKIDSVFRIAPYYYNKAIKIVKTTPVLSLLKQNGYNLYNLSIFDLLNYPAFKKELFISISTTQIVFYNTIWSSLRRDLTWQLFPNLVKKQLQEKRMNMKKFSSPQRGYNNKVLDSLSKFPVDSLRLSPIFVYAHLLMPHFPYFYDSTGYPYPDEAIYADSILTDKNKFLNYIVYTNHKIDTLISQLIKKSDGKDIIVIQSDHGSRDILNWSRKEDVFRNYTAFYFPDKDYRLLYDSMSNVNTFRVILNKYFGQQLPLLPDKSYYIK